MRASHSAQTAFRPLNVSPTTSRDDGISILVSLRLWNLSTNSTRRRCPKFSQGKTPTVQSRPALPRLMLNSYEECSNILCSCLLRLHLTWLRSFGRDARRKGKSPAGSWPKYDPALAKEDEIEIPVQINGKLRARIVVPAHATEDTIRTHALAEEKVKGAIAGKQIVRVIVVPLKLVNVVVRW